MTDIVEHLRMLASAKHGIQSMQQQAMQDAAEEIERLRARCLELNVHASRWMTAHDNLKSGKEYQLPSPDIAPDYCYDPLEWDSTYHWADRDEMHDYGSVLGVREILRVRTLYSGPDRWAAKVPITFDEHGDPDETEVQWFRSEEEATAAVLIEAKVPR